jgi:cyclopropane-fatty-acyl-phospholipid synthase
MTALAKDFFLRKFRDIQFGQIDLHLPNGKKETFVGKSDGTRTAIKLRDWRVIRNLALNGDIGFAEDYREGLWETDDLPGLLSFAMENETSVDALIFGSLPARWIERFANVFSRNTRGGSRRNIRAHYDLGNDFYALWLDKTMTYSSALFNAQHHSLEDAQHAKYDRILTQTGKTGGSVLEIGCGWGGLAERALEKGDYHIKGITLSERQKSFADSRLSGRAEIALEDYRDQSGTYDSIVSIEMFEAVGEEYWPAYFNKIKNLLHRDGHAVIQTITISDSRFPKYRNSSDFIRKHIFPGGMLPSPSLFVRHAEKAGLGCADQFGFGKDYALTLETWLRNFDSCRAEINALGYNDAFTRMWRFYLAACIASFRTQRTDVIQFTLRHE